MKMWNVIVLLTLSLLVLPASPILFPPVEAQLISCANNTCKIAETSYGDLYFVGNELLVRSKNADPPKVRLQAPANSLSKGTISFDTRRPDGRYEEIAFIQGKQDERYRANQHDYTGQIDIHVRRYVPGTPDDPQFRKIVEASWDRWFFHVPMGMASVPAPSPPPVSPFEIQSPDGRFFIAVQNDGNVVAYDRQTGRAELLISLSLGMKVVR